MGDVYLNTSSNDVLLLANSNAGGGGGNISVRSIFTTTYEGVNGGAVHITAGHDVEIVQNENVQKIIEQGILWATR